MESFSVHGYGSYLWFQRLFFSKTKEWKKGRKKEEEDKWGKWMQLLFVKWARLFAWINESTKDAYGNGKRDLRMYRSTQREMNFLKIHRLWCILSVCSLFRQVLLINIHAVIRNYYELSVLNILGILPDEFPFKLTEKVDN